MLGLPLTTPLALNPNPLTAPPRAASHPLHTLPPCLLLPVVGITARLQPPPCALPLFQFYELFLAINMVLRAHLSGPAALESACRAAHDRSKLTRMILELLLIPSAPRAAPGSVTWCQAGQPPPALAALSSFHLLTGSCLLLRWGPSLSVLLAPHGDPSTVPSRGHGPLAT